ncbi:MAG: alcohol dehydrogenase catalytic domain-containing protein [Treponema sp.]|jgi:L-gulonate 5-dehydrogenase|nr:alcohol dehydrogenase catalytic domain-containing protein [Treponema sp.]
MKAGLVETPGVLKIVDRDEPKITKNNDVLIKVKRVGISGSDIRTFRGRNPPAVYPLVWGHELAGEVIDAGLAVTNFRPGDRVAVEPILCCGTCRACRQGRRHECEQLRVMGVHVDGGCQEYVVVPDVNVFALPPDLPWDEAVLIEPFTIGVHAAYRGGVRPNDTVLIMGAGTVGISAAQMAKLAGATVIVTGGAEDNLAYAKSRGVDYTINPKHGNILTQLREITGGKGATVVIGAERGWNSPEETAAFCSAAGRVVEIAPQEIVQRDMSTTEGRPRPKRFPAVINYIRQGKLRLSGFVSKAYPLAQMAEAFDYVDKNNATVRKVVISVD